MYAADWLSDEHVLLMTMAQQGAYLRLLCHNWTAGDLPANPRTLARMLALDEESFVSDIWPALERHFEQAAIPDRITNRRLSAIHDLQHATYRRLANSGRKGGKKTQEQRRVNTTLAKPGLSKDASMVAKAKPDTDTDTDTESDTRTELGGGDGLPGDLILSTQNQHCSTRAERALNQRAFDAFWKAYPRKQAKKVARQVFARLSPTDDRLDTMLSAIEEQKATRQWIEGFIPLPTTWLRQERWTDQMLAPAGRDGGIKKHNDEIFARLRKKEDTE
jgi:uncharacterized protein YdaU (DUF1376 family)